MTPLDDRNRAGTTAVTVGSPRLRRVVAVTCVVFMLVSIVAVPVTPVSASSDESAIEQSSDDSRFFVQQGGKKGGNNGGNAGSGNDDGGTGDGSDRSGDGEGSSGESSSSENDDRSGGGQGNSEGGGSDSTSEGDGDTGSSNADGNADSGGDDGSSNADGENDASDNEKSGSSSGANGDGDDSDSNNGNSGEDSQGKEGSGSSKGAKNSDRGSSGEKAEGNGGSADPNGERGDGAERSSRKAGNGNGNGNGASGGDESQSSPGNSEAARNGDGPTGPEQNSNGRNGRSDEAGPQDRGEGRSSGGGGGPNARPGDAGNGNGPPGGGIEPGRTVPADARVSVTANDAGGEAPDRGLRGTDRAGDRSRSTVSVEVSDVRAGSRVAIDTSSVETEDDTAALDTITTDVKRSGGFTMEITTSRARLQGSPAFERDDGAVALERIRLEHSISNEDVEDVTLTFRVSKERLKETGTDPERVAMYRYADGSWAMLETKLVGETAGHYVLEALSPGMSEFAIGAQRPSFDLWRTTIEDESLTPGGTLLVSGRVTNVGSGDGSFDATLVVGGDVVAQKSVTVAKKGTRQVNFAVDLRRPGTHEVYLNGRQIGTVSVGTSERSADRSSEATLLGNEPRRWLAVVADVVEPAFGPFAVPAPTRILGA